MRFTSLSPLTLSHYTVNYFPTVFYPPKFFLLRLQINVTIDLNSHFLPQTVPLFRLLLQQPHFYFSQKPPTYRMTPVREQASSLLSLLLSKQRSKTQTFTDLSLHCYHCRKTQQIRAGKGSRARDP